MKVDFDKSYKKIVEEAYDLMADEYDKLDMGTPFFINTYRACGHYVKKLLPYWENKVVLDVGCGTGFQSVQFAASASMIIAIDLSEQLIRRARNKINKLGQKKIFFLKGDATNIPLRNNSVDYVSSYGEVIGHIPEYEKAIAEMGRVCRPGGIVTIEYDNKWHLGLLYEWRTLLNAIRTPSKGDLRVWTYEYMKFEKKVDLIYKTFAFSEIRSFLEENGLELIKVAGIHILSSLVPPQYQTPFNNNLPFLNLFTKLIVYLGKVDLMLNELYPFNRLGFTSILISRKR